MEEAWFTRVDTKSIFHVEVINSSTSVNFMFANGTKQYNS